MLQVRQVPTRASVEHRVRDAEHFVVPRAPCVDRCRQASVCKPAVYQASGVGFHLLHVCLPTTTLESPRVPRTLLVVSHAMIKWCASCCSSRLAFAPRTAGVSRDAESYTSQVEHWCAVACVVDRFAPNRWCRSHGVPLLVWRCLCQCCVHVGASLPAAGLLYRRRYLTTQG